MQELSEMTQLMLRDDLTIVQDLFSGKFFVAKNGCKPISKQDYQPMLSKRSILYSLTTSAQEVQMEQ